MTAYGGRGADLKEARASGRQGELTGPSGGGGERPGRQREPEVARAARRGDDDLERGCSIRWLGEDERGAGVPHGPTQEESTGGSPFEKYRPRQRFRPGPRRMTAAR